MRFWLAGMAVWIGLAGGAWVPGPAALAQVADGPHAAKRTTTRPATRPATGRAAHTPATVPSLRETIEMLQKQRKAREERIRVACIDVDRPVAEQPARFVLLADLRLTLQSLLGRLKQAEKDKDLRAVLLNMGDTMFNLAQAQELSDALARVVKAGKRVFVYADSYDTASYLAACGASDICMLSGGELVMPGLRLETLFAKGLLDKIGIQADYVQIGQYKGADEMFTRTEPSPETRQELNKILDSLYEQIVELISHRRNLPPSRVADAINDVVMTGKVARERGFVDHLVNQDEIEEMLQKELGRAVHLLEDYGTARREDLDLSNPLALLSSLMRRVPEHAGKPAVGLIYLDGVLVDGEVDPLFGEGAVGSQDVRDALRAAAQDETICGVVLRIDSPGGSALASEVMWQAVNRLADQKPVVVSVGSMAASGGYYVACGADWIIADPTAIVGSIGVVGGKFVFRGLFDKVGVNTEDFIRGRNADLFSWSRPFTEQQRRLVTGWMKQVYDRFTDRVMATRQGKIRDLDRVAQGRVFVARQARDLGMVDELGGLEAAIEAVAREAELEEGTYEVRVIPPTRTLVDLLRGKGAKAQLPARGAAPEVNQLLRWLSGRTGRLARQQWQIMRLLEDRPVALLCPYVVMLR